MVLVLVWVLEEEAGRVVAVLVVGDEGGGSKIRNVQVSKAITSDGGLDTDPVVCGGNSGGGDNGWSPVRVVVVVVVVVGSCDNEDDDAASVRTDRI